MKLLQNKTGVDAPDATWPYGKSKDNTGSNNGFDLNSANLEDYHQFFERLFAKSGLTANNLPDNSDNGFQLYEAFRKIARPYKVYTALISQTGTSDPTVTVLGLNDLSNITWTRVALGQYRGTAATSGDFIDDKTFHQISTGITGGQESFLQRLNDTAYQIDTYVGGVPADSVLNDTCVELRVYDDLANL